MFHRWFADNLPQIATPDGLLPALSQRQKEQPPFPRQTSLARPHATPAKSLMELLWITSLILLVVTILLLVVSYLRGTMELFSYQLAFQVGMMVFFYVPILIAPAFAELTWPYMPNGSGGVRMAMALVLFNIVYFAFGALGKRALWTDRITPTFEFLPVNLPALGLMTVGMLLASFLIFTFAFSPGSMNLFDAVIIGLVPSLGAFACAMATVMVMRQWFNVLWYILLAVVFGLALLATISFSNDRRYALGVLIIIPWMTYYGLLRYKSKATTIGFSVIGAALALGFVVVYSSFRHDVAVRAENVGQRVSQFQSANVGGALSVKNVTGLLLQDSAYNSMYFIENYPETQDHRPLHGLFFLVTNPIPRSFFPSKPMALGILMQGEVGASANLGPGIIGHAWMEAGWIGILYYAAFFGFGIATVDRLIKARMNNPYFIAAVGANMGNVIGLARGETSLFMVLIGFGLIGTWLFSRLIASTLGSFAKSSPPFCFGQRDEKFEEDYGEGEHADAPTVRA